jgi:hypothetical protein
MKTLISLVLAAVLAFVAWPYYRMFQLDGALGNDNLQELSPLVDLEAVRQNYRKRFGSGLEGLTAGAAGAPPLAWLRDQIKQLGNSALDQAISLQWVMDTLRGAATRHSSRPTPYFLSAVNFAFFDGWDSFLIRLGGIADNPTHVRMTLKDRAWRVTDIIQ